jgi:hypothetical protein
MIINMTEKKFKDHQFVSQVRKVGGAVGLIFSVSECRTHGIKLNDKLVLDDVFVLKEDGVDDDRKL